MSTQPTEAPQADTAGYGKERNVNLLEAMRIYVRVVERGSISGPATASGSGARAQDRRDLEGPRCRRARPGGATDLIRHALADGKRCEH
jgi:hypothetical protein